MLRLNHMFFSGRFGICFSHFFQELGGYLVIIASHCDIADNDVVYYCIAVRFNSHKSRGIFDFFGHFRSSAGCASTSCVSIAVLTTALASVSAS